MSSPLTTWPERWQLLTRCIACVVLCLAVSGIQAATMDANIPVLRTPGFQPITGLNDRELVLQRVAEDAVARGDYQRAEANWTKLRIRLEKRLGANAASVWSTRFNLAVLAHRENRYQEALRQYRELIDHIEASGHFRHPAMAAPLFGMGSVLQALNEHALAVDTIQRAIFITRTDKGLNSLEQTQYDNNLMQSLLALGDVEGARSRQEVRLELAQRSLPEGPELLAEMSEIAAWYRVMGDHRREANIQQRRLEILESLYGDDHIELVPAYHDLAQAYQRMLREDIDQLRSSMRLRSNTSFSAVRTRQYEQRLSTGFDDDYQKRDLINTERQAVIALRTAIRIQKDEQASPESRAKTLVLLGDHHLALGKTRTARRYYDDAWELLAEYEASEAQQQFFAQPVPVFEKTLPSTLRDDLGPGLLAKGQITLKLEVSASGKARDVEVTDMEPAEIAKFERRLLRYARQTVFRPRWSDEGAVETPDHQYTYRFLSQRGS